VTRDLAVTARQRRAPSIPGHAWRRHQAFRTAISSAICSPAVRSPTAC